MLTLHDKTLRIFEQLPPVEQRHYANRMSDIVSSPYLLLVDKFSAIRSTCPMIDMYLNIEGVSVRQIVAEIKDQMLCSGRARMVEVLGEEIVSLIEKCKS